MDAKTLLESVDFSEFFEIIEGDQAKVLSSEMETEFSAEFSDFFVLEEVA